MATSTYMQGRKKYQRPQAILFADNPGTLDIVTNSYVPDGYEVGTSEVDGGDFLILSDDGRDPISVKVDRIESRQRMVNGRMRSYHVADKLNLSTSWKLLPSRSFNGDPAFDAITGTPLAANYTTDGGAGGVALLDWYNNHTGSFWVYLSYDNYENFAGENKYQHLNQYSEVREMFISDFNYSIQKRGGTNFDMWDISIALEEA
jgi:hypothetical protein